MFHFSDSAVFTTNRSTPFTGCFCRLKIDWTHRFHEPSRAVAALSKLRSNVFIEPYVRGRLRRIISLYPLIAESARLPSVGFCTGQSAGLEKWIYPNRAAVAKMCWTRSVWSTGLVELLPSSHSHGKRKGTRTQTTGQSCFRLVKKSASKNENFIYRNAPKNQANL